jgi:hypothetical protein
MHLRITRARFDPATFEQIEPASREVDAAMRRLPGLRHYHQGVDRAAGTVAAVSVFDGEEQARFAREALGDPIGRLVALGVRFEDPEIYEVFNAEDVGA